MNNSDPDRQKEKMMDGGSPENRAPLPQEVQGRIGNELRQVYGRLLAEPLPDKFTKLLEDLAKGNADK